MALENLSFSREPLDPLRRSKKNFANSRCCCRDGVVYKQTNKSETRQTNDVMASNEAKLPGLIDKVRARGWVKCACRREPPRAPPSSDTKIHRRRTTTRVRFSRLSSSSLPR